jgi:hypothetical protein
MPMRYNLHDHSKLVWFRFNLEGIESPAEWMVLDHQWGGFSCNRLQGWVKPTPVSAEGQRTLESIRQPPHG